MMDNPDAAANLAKMVAKQVGGSSPLWVLMAGGLPAVVSAGR